MTPAMRCIWPVPWTGSGQTIIIYDQHPLRLDLWHGVRIISPSFFLETELNLQS